MSVRWFLGIFWTISVVGNSVAATMDIVPARENDSALGTIIAVYGDILPGDGLKFQNAAKDAGAKATVLFDSNGGSLAEGIEIGREIRKLGYNTTVVQTCASACALAWLAGTNRYVAESARIGFHVAFVNGVERRESGMANAIVGLYLGELGFGQNVVEYVTSAAPDEMQWLNARDASLLGIRAEVFSADPPAQPAATVSTASPNEEAAARDFVISLVDTHTRSNSVALSAVLIYYADEVTYFGKTLDIAAIVADKNGYFERWPSRSTHINPETLRVECADNVCLVSGTYDWSVASAKRNKSAAGKATFSYGLKMRPEIKVFMESGEVIRK
jgi:hypothetical protein